MNMADVLVNDLLPILGVPAVTFLATNADNLVLLFAFLADRSFRAWHVIVGYALWSPFSP